MKNDKNIYKVIVDSKRGTSINIEVPNQPLRLIDAVPVMHCITDVLVQNAISRSEQVVTCGPGCGVCCKQLVPLSVPEVFYTVEKLLTVPLGQRGYFLEMFDQNEKVLDMCNFTDALRKIDITKNDSVIAKEYFGLGLFCPFLINQSCSIHEWRPVVCREFNSLSDPALCDDPFNNLIKKVNYYKRPSSVLARLCSVLTGVPSIFIPVPLLFENFEKFKEISTHTWPSDDLIQKLLDMALNE